MSFAQLLRRCSVCSLCSYTLCFTSSCRPTSNGKVNNASAASVSHAPHDDPRTCIEPPSTKELEKPAWVRELDPRIDAALPKLAACRVDEDGLRYASVALEFDERGEPIAQTLVKSTLTHCAIAECIKKALAGIKAPRPSPDDASYTIDLELKAGSAPRRAAGPYSNGPVPASACADSTPPGPGTLSPAEIQRVVRQSFGLFRQCYEARLAHDSTLQGRIGTRFVIETTGIVSQARVQENSLPDCEVARCVAGEFSKLRFPRPVGRGHVTVVYPIDFSPG
jgi:hypothetical protein